MGAFSHLALQQAIYSALHGDSSLMAVVSGVFDFVPEGTAFPYVVIRELAGYDKSSIGSPGVEYRITLQIFTQQAGQKQTAQIMDRVYQLLHQQNVSVSGQMMVMIAYVSSNIVLRDDGVTYQGEIQFQAITRL